VESLVRVANPLDDHGKLYDSITTLDNSMNYERRMGEILPPLTSQIKSNRSRRLKVAKVQRKHDRELHLSLWLHTRLDQLDIYAQALALPRDQNTMLNKHSPSAPE
jgi:hypothetical protein